jgi:hypothetical protein
METENKLPNKPERDESSGQKINEDLGYNHQNLKEITQKKRKPGIEDPMAEGEWKEPSDDVPTSKTNSEINETNEDEDDFPYDGNRYATD